MLTHIERARCKTNVHGVGRNQRYSSSGRCGGIETKDTFQVVAVVESKFMAHTRQLMKLAKQQQPNTV
ncbi:hypothetical protein R7040_04800 [Vibrio sp. 1069]|uniref:hypothetical protein n=1 Tax=Vibrio TaxID=662 RepID=UPI001B83F109|nr:MULTISPECIES: hypothetical protein [unclassified Vibrio]MDW1761055.1 hypothetical protein [Vibrio sp. Vb2135]MDW2330412.1 hypothetical protein [Vibrio sp. 1069]HBC3969989.1 hypothetical protein [Vibrio alginolyticus]